MHQSGTSRLLDEAPKHRRGGECMTCKACPRLFIMAYAKTPSSRCCISSRMPDVSSTSSDSRGFSAVESEGLNSADPDKWEECLHPYPMFFHVHVWGKGIGSLSHWSLTCVESAIESPGLGLRAWDSGMRLLRRDQRRVAAALILSRTDGEHSVCRSA